MSTQLKNIDSANRTKLLLDGDERLLGRDALGDFKFSIDTILREIKAQAQLPSYVNLLVKRNAGSPNTKIDLAFDLLLIEGIEKLSGSYTLDITSSGALGLDTGSEAISTWYYVWVIAKADLTVSAILSASSTSPTMPNDYIYKRLVSMVYNSSGGDFVDFAQYNNEWRYIAVTTLAALINIEVINISGTMYIPLLVSKIKMSYTASANKGGVFYNIDVSLYGYINGLYSFQTRLRSINVGAIGQYVNVSSYFEIITTNRTIRHDGSACTASPENSSTFLFIHGFEVPL